MAPIKVAVFPLVKNKPELMAKARGIYESIQLRHSAFWDVSGAIGEGRRGEETSTLKGGRDKSVRRGGRDESVEGGKRQVR